MCIRDSTGAVPADEADREQPEETAETVSPVQRLAQLTAELDALHNDRLLVSPPVSYTHLDVYKRQAQVYDRVLREKQREPEA